VNYNWTGKQEKVLAHKKKKKGKAELKEVRKTQSRETRGKESSSALTTIPNIASL
jgi:hypothetical protein